MPTVSRLDVHAVDPLHSAKQDNAYEQEITKLEKNEEVKDNQMKRKRKNKN